jgi:hypothetical protein
MTWQPGTQLPHFLKSPLQKEVNFNTFPTLPEANGKTEKQIFVWEQTINSVLLNKSPSSLFLSV